MDYSLMLRSFNCPAVIFDREGRVMAINQLATYQRELLASNLQHLPCDGELHNGIICYPVADPPGSRMCLYISEAQGDITRSIALLSSQPFLRTMLDNSEIAITIADLEGSIILFSHGAEMLTGYTAEEVIGKVDMREMYANRKEINKLQDDMIRYGAIPPRTVTLRRKDGNINKVQVNLALLRDADGKPVGSLGVTLDITREERLRQLAQGIVEHLPTGLAALDPEGTVQICNDAFTRIYGISMAKNFGVNLFEKYTEFDRYRADFVRARENAMMVAGEKEEFSHGRGRTGYRRVSFYPIFEEGKVALIIMRADDITGEVELDKIVVAAEKMNAVAGLAAGMAHEINNPLSGIIQSADLLQRTFNLDDPRTVERMKTAGFDAHAVESLRHYLTERKYAKLVTNILHAGERVSRIIGGLLEFSRKRQLSRRPWAPQTVVEKALALGRNDEELQRLEGVDIEELPGSDSFELLADLPQLLQVLLHILHSSVDNVLEKARNLSPDSRWRPKIIFSYAVKGNCGIIHIEDNGRTVTNGEGNTDSEPFFTTLRAVRGGYGLAVARFILSEFLQGNLEITPREPEGNCYTIRLPLVA